MRTPGAKGKPKTFNVSLGQLRKILNFDNDNTVLEVSIRYLPLLGLEPTQIITSPSVIAVKEKQDKTKIAQPTDLSGY